ncbi:MAG: hypothetical protein WDM89_08280 [Rhizomicrobium sp.]
MRAGDIFVNNTGYHLVIVERDGVEITMLEPGCVFEASRDMMISFDANPSYTFRSYVNQGYPGN